MQPIRRILFLFIYCFYFVSGACAQQHDLSFYIQAAHQNSPVLKELENSQKINLLQNDLTAAQYKKPQVNFTADYLFAPYFFNRGQFMVVTSNPEKNAYGYDIGLSNGGLYATQLNISAQLFTGGILTTYTNQINAQNNLLQNNIKQTEHDLDKTVSDQYVMAFQLEQQVNYLRKIISLVDDRRKVVEALVKNGLMQQSDYLLLEIEIKQREYDIQQQQLNLSAAFNQLNTTCVMNDTALIPLTPPVINQSALLQQFNYQNKFIIDSTNISLQQQVFNIKYKPQLFASGNTGLYAADASNISHNLGLSAALHLNIPIYDGGQKKTVEQQNKLLLENLQQYKQQSASQQQMTLASLQQQIKITQHSIELLNSQLLSQETLLQMLKDKVVTGQTSVTDFLNAVENYVNSNQDKLQAQTNLSLLINQFNYVNW